MRTPALLIFLLFSLMGLSQDPVPRNGPKFGVSMASISSGSFLSWSGQPKFGPLGGWSFEAPLSNQASLLIEPLLMSKGSVAVNSMLKTRTSVSQLYLEMPLLLKLSIQPDQQGLYLSGGLMYGYFIRGRVRSYQNGTLLNNYAFSSTQGNSQWSLALGLGRERGNWLWELRGQNSIRLFSRYAYAYAHNIVMSLQVAWRFPRKSTQRRKSEEEQE